MDKTRSSLYSHRKVNIGHERMPFPLVAAGIGLSLAYVFPGGLSGGQGFLIGFTTGVLIPGIVTLYMMNAKARKDQLAKIETELSKLRAARRRESFVTGRRETE